MGPTNQGGGTMARKTEPVAVSPEELAELYSMSQSRTLEYRSVQRAKVILLCNQGKSIRTIHRMTGMGVAGVHKWRKRFLARRLEGLRDAPRPGRPMVYSAAQRAAVIQKACSAPGGGYARWTQRRIASAMGMSHGLVNSLLRKADLKPHTVHYWCGKSTDPEFETKMIDVIGLYMNPPQNALVLSVDEKTQMQALDRSQPVLPLKPKLPKRLTATYKRNGTVALIAALAVHSGDVTAQTISSTGRESFLGFLKTLYRKFPNKELHIVLDNLPVHKHPDVQQWVASKRRLHLHFTPTYSSWLNQVEIWFNILSKDVLKGGVWKSKQQLIDQLMLYVKTYNSERAKPFNWTYTGQPLTV
jgi:transposase